VVDDGSKVEVPAVLARGPGQPAIQVIRQRNSGPAAARNTGIAAPGALFRYVCKHFSIGYRTREARTQLSRSAGIALSWPGRLRMLRYLIAHSGGGMTGGMVAALVLLAYGLEVLGRLLAPEASYVG
jgi:glycosyltransferase involved in cell wall biosynthesis